MASGASRPKVRSPVAGKGVRGPMVPATITGSPATSRAARATFTPQTFKSQTRWSQPKGANCTRLAAKVLVWMNRAPARMEATWTASTARRSVMFRTSTGPSGGGSRAVAMLAQPTSTPGHWSTEECDKQSTSHHRKAPSPENEDGADPARPGSVPARSPSPHLPAPAVGPQELAPYRPDRWLPRRHWARPSAALDKERV